jgi:uncharacterized protein (DUF1778 family)
MEKAKKTEKIGIRATEELRNLIKEEADIQNRSESNMIITILDEYFYNKKRIQQIAERK